MSQNETKNTPSEKNRRPFVWAWVALVLLLALVGVAIAFGCVKSRQNAQAQSLQGKLENNYRQSYYELTYSLSNLLDNLNKLRVASSPAMQMQLLGQVNTYATQAATAINGVGNVQQTQRVTKCLNQAGDYCLRLQYTLALGGALTQDDRDALAGLYMTLGEIERSMAAVQDQVEQDGFAFVDALGENNALVGDTLAQYEAQAVSYPALIYDGPFSDALENKRPKGLQGETLDQQRAASLVSTYLPYEGTVTYTGKLEGTIPAYCYQIDTDVGVYRVQITCQGGYLAALDCDAHPQDTTVSQQDAIAFGQAYLTSIGLEQMQAVWVSNYNSVYYINYAYTQEDVVCYSDLVVLQIDAETKRLVGVEALNYLYNHTERDLATPAIDERAAQGAISPDIEVASVRLALIPTAGGGEKLTYEVYGKMGEDQYFVYVDAASGAEYKIMRVIDSGEGELIR